MLPPWTHTLIYIIFLTLIAFFPFQYLKGLFFSFSCFSFSLFIFYLAIHWSPQTSLLWLLFLFRCFLLCWDSLSLAMTLYVTVSPCAFPHCRLRACVEGSSLHFHLFVMFIYNVLALSLHFLCSSYHLVDYNIHAVPFISFSMYSYTLPPLFSHTLVKLFIGDRFADLLCLIISIHF